jgi:FkbH-like protein
MKLLLVSDFNLQNLAGYLRNAGEKEIFEVALTPFGQVQQAFLTIDSALWEPKPDACVVWTRPESALPSFQALLEGKTIETAAIFEEVDSFVRLLSVAANRAFAVFVPTWVLPPHHAGHGLEDLANASGPVRCLLAANLRLVEAIQELPSVFPLVASKWMELAGPTAHNFRLWYSAKVPFGNDVFKHAARDIISALRGVRGRARKLILLDLDDTLWGGTVGEIGWEELLLGGHDPIGEALADFQKTLKALSRRGVALGILSKNDEAVALEAVRRHPEMVLKLDDFAGWRINWSDKAKNLAELVRELGLGLDSVVFFDDNPVERARIRESFPEVLVPELPDDKRLYIQTLLGLDCFNKPRVTDEDRNRVKMYADERKRNDVRNSVSSIDDWLVSLKMVVTASPLNDENIMRVTQLLNKTNQMNLSTRRLTESELSEWRAAPGRMVWAFRVADRCGDSGLTGVLGMATDNGHALITDFVLSCRVMGRRVEETMLHVAVEWARESGLVEVRAIHKPTAKNQPCADFFRRSSFIERKPGNFVWDTTKSYPAPATIGLVWGDGELLAGGRKDTTPATS